jgi:uncharacterized protein YdiU (UPF0061 family)
MGSKGKAGWNFDNSYTQLPEKLFSWVTPEPVSNPNIVFFNHALAEDLGLDFSNLSDKELSHHFAGNSLYEGSEPISQAYAGHQFGYFTMLGDGRAILLGEHISPGQQRFDIQLKGAGKTPYSRNGDGRATLYSMLREYLISEAIHGLKIPTSRSLAVVSTGEPVYREMIHPGAVLTRVAKSHIRVGTFEFLRAFFPDYLGNFIGYTLNRHFPIAGNTENFAIQLFKAVAEQQAGLMVHWWRVGFVHGVMNTDNMGIAGETFDYGPCAFINSFNPDRVFSSIDVYGRYRFGNQPAIARWNLNCLGMALLPEIDHNESIANEIIKELLADFDSNFQHKWLEMMCNKLGIEKPQHNDMGLITGFLQWMKENQVDYTNSFLLLESILKNETSAPKGVKMPEYDWILHWKLRLADNSKGIADAINIMEQNNPMVIPRNHRVEEALKDASFENDFTAFNLLLKNLSQPYNRSLERSIFQNPPEEGDDDYQTFCGT